MKRLLHIACLCLFFCLFFCSCGKVSTSKLDEHATGGQKYDSLVACYQRALGYKDSGKTERALKEFEKCLQIDATDAKDQAIMQPLVVEAFHGLLDVFQTTGNSQACVKEFETILNTPPSHIVSNLCMRDAKAYYAYSLYLVEGKEKEAENIIVSLLKQPLLGPTTFETAEGNKREFHSERLFRDYTFAAMICKNNVSRQSDVVKWGLKALELSHECGGINGEQSIIHMLSQLYLRQSRMLEAVTLLESIIERYEEQKDTVALVNTYNTLATIYNDYALFEQANTVTEEAMRLLQSTSLANPSLTLQTCLARASVLFDGGQQSQAYQSLKQAEKTAMELPYDSGRRFADYVKGVFLTKDTSRTNVDRGIVLLHKTTRNAEPYTKSKAYYHLAQAYEQQHDYAHCEAMLDSLYVFTHKSSSPIFVRGLSNFAVNYYRSRNNLQMLARYATELQQENENYCSPQLVHALMKNEVCKREHTDEASQAERLCRQRIVYAILAGIFFLIIVAMVVLIVYNHSKFKTQMGRIKNDYEADKREKDETIKRLRSVTENGNSKSELLQCAMNLSDDDSIMRFENLFSQLYPNFDKQLSNMVPNIGKRERKVCQLVFLNFSSAQIAQSLNVAARSVTIYRYRIRQKMNIKDYSLEEVLKSFE